MGWQPIETVPNNTFDVVAKYWDAALDMILYRRICDCVLVDDEIVVSTIDGPRRITDFGMRATHWMHIPTLPETVQDSPVLSVHRLDGDRE